MPYNPSIPTPDEQEPPRCLVCDDVSPNAAVCASCSAALDLADDSRRAERDAERGAYPVHRVLARTPMQRREQGVVLAERLTRGAAGRLADALRAAGAGELVYWTEPMPLWQQAEILDDAEAAIRTNVEAFYADEIDLDTFRARQREQHARIEAAGMQDAFLRRWRRAHAEGGALAGAPAA